MKWNAMTNKRLEDMTNEELIILALNAQCTIKELEDQIYRMGWQLNPDRMGGQFTEEEINRGLKW